MKFFNYYYYYYFFFFPKCFNINKSYTTVGTRQNLDYIKEEILIFLQDET